MRIKFEVQFKAKVKMVPIVQWLIQASFVLQKSFCGWYMFGSRWFSANFSDCLIL